MNTLSHTIKPLNTQERMCKDSKLAQYQGRKCELETQFHLNCAASGWNMRSESEQVWDAEKREIRSKTSTIYPTITSFMCGLDKKHPQNNTCKGNV